MHADAIIIGGGIHGCSAALHLARSGIKPVVFEQAYSGRHASGVNAGGVRRLGRHLAEIPLSLAAMEMWNNIQAWVDDDCGFQQTSQIKVAENDTELESLKQRVQLLQNSGFSHEKIIDREELQQRVPSISDHCCGAIVSEDDGHAKPFRTVQAFNRAAVKSGAQIFSGEAVQDIERDNNIWRVKTTQRTCEAPILINAAGAWGSQVAAYLGEQVPMTPTALMLMITERLDHFCTPVVGATGRTLSFKQFNNGTVLIGGGHYGTADVKNQKTYLNAHELSINAQTAQAIFPLMKNVRIVRSWAGIEGVISDNIPVISPSRTYPDAYHVFGFSAHGFQLGPITGQIISQLILDGKSILPIDEFSINRFCEKDPASGLNQNKRPGII